MRVHRGARSPTAVPASPRADPSALCVIYCGHAGKGGRGGTLRVGWRGGGGVAGCGGRRRGGAEEGCGALFVVVSSRRFPMGGAIGDGLPDPHGSARSGIGFAADRPSVGRPIYFILYNTIYFILYNRPSVRRPPPPRALPHRSRRRWALGHSHRLLERRIASSRSSRRKFSTCSD